MWCSRTEAVRYDDKLSYVRSTAIESLDLRERTQTHGPSRELFHSSLLLSGGLYAYLGRRSLDHSWTLSNGYEMEAKIYYTKETVTKTLIWVQFPSVPSELLDEEFISSMGDRIGRTIKVDGTSLTRLRAKFAGCCVEIDLSSPLISSLIVFDFKQKVNYEGLHLICFECGVYGHGANDCPRISNLFDLVGDLEAHS